MEGDVSVSALPWCWVIESLARSQQVSVTPLLCELVSKIPSSLGDSARKAKEGVALRCLEDLFGACNGLRNNRLKSPQCGKGFDLAESCNDVLQRILREASGSNMLNDASDELKQDACCFIECKKTRLPRSTLELLKNTIVEGTHPLAASLKETSGVTVQNQSVERIRLNGDGGPISPSSTIEENGPCRRAMLPEEDNDSAGPKTGREPAHVQFPTGNSLHCKRGENAFSIDNLVQNTNNISPNMENPAPPGKKLKLDKQYCVQSKQSEAAPSGGSGKESYEAELGQSYQCPEANRMLNGKSHRENSRCPDKINVEDSDQLDVSPGNDEPLPKKINLQTKLSFLGSQCSFSEDSLAMADMETNLCMKCNKGGQLLICNASSCPLAFHVSCLGRSANFDDEGNFYCPFCAYSRAISELVKAKKKASLARRELSLFIGGRSSFQPECDSKRAREDEDVNQQGQDEDVDNAAKLKNHGNVVSEVVIPRQLRSSRGKEQKFSAPSAPVVEPKNLANDVNQIANARLLRSSKGKELEFSEPPAPSDEPKSGGNVATQVANRRQLRSLKGKQQKLSALSDPTVEHASANISSEDKQGAEIMVQLASDKTGKDQKQEDHGSDSCKLPYKNENTGGASRQCAEPERKEKTTGYQATELEGEVSSESISDSDGLSEDEKKNATTSVLSPTPLSVVPANQRSRRKKVPWTAEEEAMLKKGVQAFVQEGCKVIPWKNILEYGASVFQKGRTAMDLKDKWRNVTRVASPRIK